MNKMNLNSKRTLAEHQVIKIVKIRIKNWTNKMNKVQDKLMTFKVTLTKEMLLTILK
jgi:hypothetical protein